MNVRRKKKRDASRRIACILLAAAVLAVQLCVPGAPGAALARAEDTSAVTSASAGNAAGGVKVTHSVSIPKSGNKTAEITIDLQSDLQVKKHTDTVFVFDCSALVNIEDKRKAAILRQNCCFLQIRYAIIQMRTLLEVRLMQPAQHGTLGKHILKTRHI